MNDEIEIRLLGRMWVRLGDGTVVPESQLTAGKANELLRYLAARADQFTSSADVIQQVWPDVPAARASASLQAGTKLIRKVLGSKSITRHVSGLQLHGCWVDVVAHRQLADEIRAAIRSRDFARVISAAKQAEALYVGDFHTHGDDGDWSAAMRDQLRAQRKLMLVDAAESAIELGWMRDAIEMSTLAISLDSSFERAHRALMFAYAGVGEPDSAVHAYERCRRNLMSGLGVPPSARTEALHFKLAAPPHNPSSFHPYVGREPSVVELSESIRDSAAGDGTQLICVVGMPGSGRESLLQAATERVPRTYLRPVRPEHARRTSAERVVQGTDLIDVAVMGPVDLAPNRAHAAIAELLSIIPPQPGRVLVIITTQATADLLAMDRSSAYEPLAIESPAMDELDLAHLAQTTLAGPPAPDLLAALASESKGLAGAAVEILRDWVSTGQVISTVRGVGLVSDSLTSTVVPAASATFRVLAEQLTPAELEICQVMAVLDRPASAAEITGIVGSGRRSESRRMRIEARMDRLESRGIFSMSGETYAYRDRTTQDLFELWLRPSLRDRINQGLDDHPDDDGLVAVHAN